MWIPLELICDRSQPLDKDCQLFGSWFKEATSVPQGENYELTLQRDTQEERSELNVNHHIDLGKTVGACTYFFT
jgi:hypothetical protein